MLRTNPFNWLRAAVWFRVPRTIEQHKVCRSHAPLFRRHVSGSLHEPDYINITPPTPVYDTLNIRLTGYDFVQLESYARYVHRMCELFNLDTSAYAVPARSKLIQCYKTGSSKPESEHQLRIYERVVQIDDLSSTTAPILIHLLQMNVPSTLQIALKHVDPKEEQFRYVPDLTLQQLQAQIYELDKIQDDRKHK